MTQAATRPHVVIAGGGPAGAAAAALFSNAGWEVDLYESRPPADLNITNPRSYKLVLMRRGLEVLESAGIDMQSQENLEGIGKAITNTVLHLGPSPVIMNEPPMTRIMFERSHLAQRLLDISAALPRVRIHYRARVVAVDFSSSTATVQDSTTGEHIEMVSKLDLAQFQDVFSII